MTLLLLLSCPPDRLKEEEEEEEPTGGAYDQPSVTTVDSDVKYGEDSKSTVAAACSRDVVDVDPASNIQKKIHHAEWFGISLQLTEEEKQNSWKERSFSICVFFLDLGMEYYFLLSFFVG